MSGRLSMWVVALLCAVACQVLIGSASAGELPDGRVYERVSSLAQQGVEVYVPNVSEAQGIEYTAVNTDLTFQAAADGDRVAYVGGPSAGGNELSGEDGGNEYLATRAGSGTWTQSNLAPTGAPSSIFQAFSADLTVGFLDAVEPLSANAPGYGETVPLNRNYDDLYATDTSGHEYTPFFTGKPPYRSVNTFQTGGDVYKIFTKGLTSGGRIGGQMLAFAGASVDSKHLLFLANDALTTAAEGRPAAEGGASPTFETEDNLYEVADGQLRLVNVLPDGTTHVNATFGGGVTGGFGESRFSRVISKDGSRIFWTDLTTGHIYARDNGTTTVEISPAGRYQTATSDGSAVFYTNGDLYEYEFDGAQTTDLTPGVPVERVVGASENGEYIYYVTNSGEFELLHNGVTTTIAATKVTIGEATPDGHSVVFMTSTPSAPGRIEVYDADTGSLHCASCANGGTKGNLALANEANVYLPRWISADGSRVFFTSREALTPSDVDGTTDVYEWERSGAGGCLESTGCVHLLSGGAGPGGTYFLDASEDGDDVFIVTRAKLTATDQDELYDVYDVRVDGEQPVTPPACTGTGCQGIPGAPPIFATPSSVTFEGVGNFAAPGKLASPKRKPKKNPRKRVKHRGSKGKKSAHKVSGHGRSGTKGGRS